jgi:dolichol-phosphate mannosyltransferase
MLLALAQAAAGGVVAARLARGRRRRPPLSAAPAPPSVSVVIPARDEEARIADCLRGLAGEDAEVIVVDDRSRDGTAAVARAFGARVVAGAEPPAGWVGKPWALQQGLEAASGEIVVALDADTRPRPGLLGALAAALADADLVTASARFEGDERWRHASMLASLVFRFGPSDAEMDPPARRLLANGQVTAVRRAALRAEGGYAPAAGHLTDDLALARALAARGWRVAFADGTELVGVRMTATEWRRSIALADVTSPPWLAADVAVVWLTMALPVLRAAAARPTRLDLALLGVRCALLAPLSRAYARRGVAFWLSPLADPLTAAVLTWGAVRPSRTWRGRTYPRSAPALEEAPAP